jgi:hypothetical protein
VVVGMVGVLRPLKRGRFEKNTQAAVQSSRIE